MHFGRDVAVGLVCDGDARIQRNKLRALGLESHFDIVVFADELGREHRKPSPVSLLAALTGLGVTARDAVFVGDRPERDVAAASAAGMRAIRVRTGKYAQLPDDPRPWATAPDAVAAIRGLLELSGQRAGADDLVDDAVVAREPGDAVVVGVARGPGC